MAQVGKVIQIAGPAVDIQFESGHLPQIYNAIRITSEGFDVPEPVLEDDEVLIAVKACGICGSDIHGWDGSSGRRNPPLIMGHAAAGELARVGARVTGWQEGDRVTFDSMIYCGTCRFCSASS